MLDSLYEYDTFIIKKKENLTNCELSSNILKCLVFTKEKNFFLPTGQTDAHNSGRFMLTNINKKIKLLSSDFGQVEEIET